MRTLGAYENVKKSYEYCRGFVGVRTLAPVVEWVAEGTLSRVPIVKNLKENASEDGYPMLHGLDNRLAELLKHFDDYVRVCVCVCNGGWGAYGACLLLVRKRYLSSLLPLPSFVHYRWT